MLQMRPNCERCDKDLAAEEAGALICSFECTYCVNCGEHLALRCPNCGGELQPRPCRSVALQEKFPPSTQRVSNPHG